jgi:hypothetical protein
LLDYIELLDIVFLNLDERRCSMPKYKLKLEVEVTCPEPAGHPELIITPAEVKESLLSTRGSTGYAVCATGKPKKHTANMVIQSIEFEPFTCQNCGHKVDVPGV